MSHADPPLDALLHPYASGLLPQAFAPLFLRARAGSALQALGVMPVAVQPFKPLADALERMGIAVHAEHPPALPRFATVWVLPPRQRIEARALLAQALDAAEEGGTVLVSVANDEGAKALEGDFRQLAGGLAGQLGKYHCRVFWARKGSACMDAALLAQWRDADAPRPVLEGRYDSRPGVFSWDRIDAGSALLARHLPQGLGGRAADLGAGWGYLSAALLAANPGLKSLDAFEADARALALAGRNLARFSPPVEIACHWQDVAAGLPAGPKFDVILSNPPFHATGKQALPALGQAFIRAAAGSLAPHGRFWLVANAHLPYEALLDERFAQVRTVAAEAGYKVLEAGVPRR